jgi:DNA-binding NarL/FixJ family response regulator
MSKLLRDLESSEHVVLLCYTLFWYARLSLWWGDIGPAADYARQGTTLGRHLNLHAELASVFDVLAEINASAGDRPGCMQAIEIVNEHAAVAWYSGDRDRLAAHAQQTLARCEFVGGSASRAAGIVRAALDRTAPPPALRASMMADEALYATLLGNSDASAILATAGRDLTSIVPFDITDACALASAGALLGLVHAVGPDGDVQSLDELPVAKNYLGFIASRSDLHDLHRFRIALRRLATGESNNVADDVAALAAGYEGLKHRGAGFEAAAVSALLQSVARRRPEVSPALGATQILFVRAADDASLRRTAPRGAALTEREAEVLSLVALGLTNKEIAQRLGLGRRTIETHVEHVLSKLNAASRTRAVAEAIRAGLLPASSWGGSEDASLA